MNEQLDQEHRKLLSELLAVLNAGELIRIKYRLRKRGNSACASLLEHELAMRKFRRNHLLEAPANAPGSIQGGF